MKNVIIALLLTASCLAANHNWQDGTVINSATSNNGAAAMPIGTMVVAVPLTSLLYRINTADLSIVVSTNKNLNVTFNKKTRVAIEGQKLFIIDDEGKEKKLNIIRKEALPQPDSAPQK